MRLKRYSTCLRPRRLLEGGKADIESINRRLVGIRYKQPIRARYNGSLGWEYKRDLPGWSRAMELPRKIQTDATDLMDKQGKQEVLNDTNTECNTRGSIEIPTERFYFNVEFK